MLGARMGQACLCKYIEEPSAARHITLNVEGKTDSQLV